MKKIIITRKQLKEAITQIQTGLTTQQQLTNAARNAVDNQNKGYNETVVDNPKATNNDVVNLTVKNGTIPSQEMNAALKANKIVVSPEKKQTGTTDNLNTTATLAETSYSKKHIEEVRSLGKVMTKRALEESWGRYDGDLSVFLKEFGQRKYHYEMMYNDFMRECEIVEQQLPLAIEIVKEELQDMGLQATNMSVDYDDDKVEIEIKTNWFLKGDDFDEDEGDYRRYRYLSRIGDDRRLSMVRVELMDNANWQDNSQAINPYFEITCELPQIGNEYNDF